MYSYECPCGWGTKFKRSMRQYLKSTHVVELARAKKILDYAVCFEEKYPLPLAKGEQTEKP